MTIASKFGTSQFDDYTWFTVYTNNVKDEILEQIDVPMTRYVSFHCPHTNGPSSNTEIRFNVTLSKWKEFAQNLKGLQFMGKLVDNGFNSIHIDNLGNLEYLQICATNYPLFQNEEFPRVPQLKKFYINGYGLVYFREDADKWIETLKKNGCEYVAVC